MDDAHERIDMPQKSGHDKRRNGKEHDRSGLVRIALKHQRQRNRRQDDQKITEEIGIAEGGKDLRTERLPPDERIETAAVLPHREKLGIQKLEEAVEDAPRSERS